MYVVAICLNVADIQFGIKDLIILDENFDIVLNRTMVVNRDLN